MAKRDQEVPDDYGFPCELVRLVAAEAVLIFDNIDGDGGAWQCGVSWCPGGREVILTEVTEELMTADAAQRKRKHDISKWETERGL